MVPAVGLSKCEDSVVTNGVRPNDIYIYVSPSLPLSLPPSLPPTLPPFLPPTLPPSLPPFLPPTLPRSLALVLTLPLTRGYSPCEEDSPDIALTRRLPPT